jgi:hypothetical protein
MSSTETLMNTDTGFKKKPQPPKKGGSIMKKINWLVFFSFCCWVAIFTASGAMATEIITAEDIKQVTIKNEQLIKKPTTLSSSSIHRVP